MTVPRTLRADERFWFDIWAKREGAGTAEPRAGRGCRFLGAGCFLLLIAGCAGARPIPAHLAVITLHLPPSLEPKRDALDKQVQACVRAATDWFATNGFEVPRGEIIRGAYVFDDRAAAHTALAERFHIDAAMIPASFAGTVDGSTLLVVTPELYRETFTDLYPDERWSIAEHQKLMVHEIAHAVHARIARDRFATEDAMGPQWFYEGLAIDCAEQFLITGRIDAPLPWAEIAGLLEADEKNALSPPTYPTYARIVRSLRANVPVSWLIDHAGDADFVDQLRREYGRESKTD